MMLEVELRSFLTEEEFNKLMDFFSKNAKMVKEDNQETIYFNTKADLRLQRNDFGSKIWLKKGKIHDDAREEFEVKVDDFEKAHDIFKAMGLDTQIKWLRKRIQFDWKGIKVCLDHTKGYGYIIELEKMCSKEEQDDAHRILGIRLKELGIKPTPRKEFEKKFEEYKKNWKDHV